MLPLASVQTAADRCDSEYLSLCRTRWITETTPGPSIDWPIYINTHFLSQVSLYFVALKADTVGGFDDFAPDFVSVRVSVEHRFPTFT